ncbi:hypothetical protein [Alteromonas gilva]|uniref:Uncharacterized protein n=1 Tax=Alteromonas gilva TaxID=2987522 RepID=A0ABT5KX76_9ALTE|nr:hypothetical protein [Alteromonas gilva]MDC8829369.1 hypothetical protein [Alteromonas gilva]
MNCLKHWMDVRRVHNKQLLALQRELGNIAVMQLLCASGNGMSRENLKKNNLFTMTVAAVFAATFAHQTMALLGLSGSTEDTGIFLLQALFFGSLFSVFNLFTTRLFKWLYS